MTGVTAPALAGHPFLRGMPPGQLDALAAAAADVTFPAGHRIFEAGGFARGARPTRSSAPSSVSGCCGCSPGGCRAPGPG
jgi:hypothetical protein